MTIFLTALSLLVAAYRIRKGLFTRVEWFLLCLWAGHFALEEAQLLVKFHFFRYDPRYFRPVSFLSWIWLAWWLSTYWHKVKRYALAALAAACIYDAVMVLKPLIPGSRRHAYVQAGDWAIEFIRNDWQGPAHDATNVFSLAEYHTPNRPIVHAHIARVPYFLNGRYSFMEHFGKVDAPDYWVIDTRRDNRWWSAELRPYSPYPWLPDYELVAERRFGKRDFEIWRRCGGPSTSP